MFYSNNKYNQVNASTSTHFASAVRKSNAAGMLTTMALAAMLCACGDGGHDLSAQSDKLAAVPASDAPFADAQAEYAALVASTASDAPLASSAPVNASVAETPTGSGTTLKNCYAGGVANYIGEDDPFYENTWALKNTGASQLVSAFKNNGVAGIDANVENVHKNGKGCTGKGVQIAIVDSGLEIDHDDLMANVVPGKSWNFRDNNDDPSPIKYSDDSDHGTAVGGIAAARGWNGEGSRGIAPFASLVGYNILSANNNARISQSNMYYLAFGARALADKRNAIVNTFGARADNTAIFNFSAGSGYAAPATVSEIAPATVSAKWGTTNLRGGLGAVYFQSSGNAYTDIRKASLPDGSKMDVNCEKSLNADRSIIGGVFSNLKGMSCGNLNHESGFKPYFYNIAAMHNTGKAASYSSSGAANWVSGFGGEYGTEEAAMITTDNSTCASGQNSVNNKNKLLTRFKASFLGKLVADFFNAEDSKDPGCNYTGRMNGTSAATPSVAGVAALMLEANPELTAQDVGYILAKTAKKVDDDIASGAREVNFSPFGSKYAWPLDFPWIVNGAGFHFQNRYGFGMVDADAAVRMASNYTAPAGRRAAPLEATGRAAQLLEVDKVGMHVAKVKFSKPDAVTGAMRLDLTLSNQSDGDLNPGQLQFVIENTATGTKSIVMPAFSSWYVGGKQFPIAEGGQKKFRFHTNAFYGEKLNANFKVTVIDFSRQSRVLSFTPKLTSFSM